MNRSKIICVDDQLGIRILLKEILKEDYNVKVVGSGKEALNIFNCFNPDLVLLDMYLGDMNGTEVLSYIKDFKPHTKVVVMSGLIGEEIKAQLDLLKPEYILKKPFDIINLKSKLASIMNENLSMEICV